MLGSVPRITGFGDRCNCAILLQGQNRPGDLIQAHLTNDAGCHAQGIEGIRRIEAVDEVKGIRRNLFFRVKSAAAQKHIGNAVLKHCAVDDPDSIFIQRFQMASCLVVEKLTQIILKIRCNRIGNCGDKCGREGRFVLQWAEFLFQGFLYRRFIFRLHLPNGNRSGLSSGVGIGDVKIVFDFADVGAVKDSDAGGTLIDPTVEPPVPTLDLQQGSGIRPLDIDQKLIREGQTVVPASSTQEVPPSLRGCYLFLGVLIQLCDPIIA